MTNYEDRLLRAIELLEEIRWGAYLAGAADGYNLGGTAGYWSGFERGFDEGVAEGLRAASGNLGEGDPFEE